MKNIQLQEIKAHFSQVVKEVMGGESYQVTLRGMPAVVVLSNLEYEALTKPKNSLRAFLQTAPFDVDELDLVRNDSLTSTRDIEL